MSKTSPANGVSLSARISSTAWCASPPPCAVACSTAKRAARYQRSAVNLEAPWELSGLGQLHDATQAADRLICFGGP